MPASYGFHPEALFEYAEATDYFLREASVRVADSFISSVESAVATLVAAPARWRIVEEPEIRRYVFSRFPFVIYYRWEPQHGRVTIYAVMHSSREPGYWRQRLERGA
jgi:plasmid stabilization system protein ParE